MLALLLPPAYPWLFVVVASLIVAFVPKLFQRYSHHHWRIPLWHFFVAALCGALLAFSAMHYVNYVHGRETFVFLFFNAEPESWDAPAMLAQVPHTPTATILRRMLGQSVIPIVAVFAGALLVRWRIKRIRQGDATAAMVASILLLVLTVSTTTWLLKSIG